MQRRILPLWLLPFACCLLPCGAAALRQAGRLLVNCLALFVCLQILDVVTTLAFLSHGVQEANPLVRLVMGCAPTPLVGLLWVKLAALALALYCWRQGRRRLLGRVNVFFVALVAWNLLALLVQVGVFV